MTRARLLADARGAGPGGESEPFHGGREAAGSRRPWHCRRRGGGAGGAGGRLRPRGLGLVACRRADPGAGHADRDAVDGAGARHDDLRHVPRDERTARARSRVCEQWAELRGQYVSRVQAEHTRTSWSSGSQAPRGRPRSPPTARCGPTRLRRSISTAFGVATSGDAASIPSAKAARQGLRRGRLSQLSGTRAERAPAGSPPGPRDGRPWAGYLAPVTLSHWNH